MQQALQRSSLVPGGFVVESAYYEGDKAVIAVRASGSVGLCPSCGTVSRRVHSRYRRHVSDLSLSGRIVQLLVIARRFRCDSVLCRRQIFTERFADHPTVPVYTPPRPGRDRPEWVVAINRNAWSQSIVIGGRKQSVRPPLPPEMRDDTAFMDRIHSYIPGWSVPKVSRDQLTDHFGLVSDFLSSCWNHLRAQSRVNKLQGRIQLGGALSGRDTTAVQKTMSGLLKLMFPDPDADIPDGAIEWAAKLALECRRRVKEQQKRIGAAEFRNTHFSFTMLPDGIEQFVSTPELHSENSIGSDPLPAGQVWALSPGGSDENPGLFRIEVTEGPGSGLKILNQSPPGPLKESVRCAEQNLYARSKELVGDRDPRAHEFTIFL